MDSIDKIISTVNEFMARDAVYIAAGSMITICVLTNLGLNIDYIILVFEKVSQFHSIVVLVSVVFLSILTYYVGLVNRDFYRLCGAVGVSPRNWYTKKCTAQVFKCFYDYEVPKFCKKSRSELDALIDQKGKCFFRSTERFKRATFLKEIVSTISSAFVTSLLFIAPLVFSGAPNCLHIVLWLLAVLTGIFGCFLSHMLCIREARIGEGLFETLGGKGCNSG